MNLLWLTWKDPKHPEAGGAEVVNDELAKRLVADGHKVKFICADFKGAEAKDKVYPRGTLNGEARQGESLTSERKSPGGESDLGYTINDYEVIRLGNKLTVYWHAYRYYYENLEKWADLIIDEVNTIPFFARQYVKEKNILFIHQLAREIWFYQMFFPLSLIGYLLEPLYLWLLNDRKVITVSNSTKEDLMIYGFKKENIKIISEGIRLTSVEKLESEKYKVAIAGQTEIPSHNTQTCHSGGSETTDRISCYSTRSGDLLENFKKEELSRPKQTGVAGKYQEPTILSLGSVRPMKRTMDIVEAFEIAKADLPILKLKIAGDISGKYGEKVKKYINKSKYKNDIEILGRVSREEKLELMRKSHVLAVTSVKEGWGLVVTEANSQGTPAVVYNVDGLRDSVRHGQTGLITQFTNPDSLALNILNLLNDRVNYVRLRQNAWEWSKEINFDKSYREFKSVILSVNEESRENQ